jgi:hypothetical protein
MTYDHWKTTNPADEFLGPEPEDFKESATDRGPPRPVEGGMFRFVLCEACQSEGRIYRGLYEDERDCGECPVCEGTGLMEIKVEFITMGDMEDYYG